MFSPWMVKQCKFLVDWNLFSESEIGRIRITIMTKRKLSTKSKKSWQLIGCFGQLSYSPLSMFINLIQCFNMPDYLKCTHCYKTSSHRCVLYVMQKRDLPTTGWANSHEGVSSFNIFLKIIFSLSILKRRPWR